MLPYSTCCWSIFFWVFRYIRLYLITIEKYTINFTHYTESLYMSIMNQDLGGDLYLYELKKCSFWSLLPTMHTTGFDGFTNILMKIFEIQSLESPQFVHHWLCQAPVMQDLLRPAQWPERKHGLIRTQSRNWTYVFWLGRWDVWPYGTWECIKYIATAGYGSEP